MLVGSSEVMVVGGWVVFWEAVGVVVFPPEIGVDEFGDIVGVAVPLPLIVGPNGAVEELVLLGDVGVRAFGAGVAAAGGEDDE